MFPIDSKILLVDDSATMRAMVRKKLNELGFQNISECNDGAPAMDELYQAFQQGQPYNLIFCDWKMPNVNGLQLLNFVRLHSGLPPETVFIMVTAESEKSTILEALHQGADAYVFKPVETVVLEQSLKRVWSQRQKKGA